MKQELANAKLEEEAFAAEKRKWQYDEQQLKLQIEAESHLVATANERATKMQMEKEKLVASVAELESKLEQSVIGKKKLFGPVVHNAFFGAVATRAASSPGSDRGREFQGGKIGCSGREVAKGGVEKCRVE